MLPAPGSEHVIAEGGGLDAQDAQDGYGCCTDNFVTVTGK